MTVGSRVLTALFAFAFMYISQALTHGSGLTAEAAQIDLKEEKFHRLFRTADSVMQIWADDEVTDKEFLAALVELCQIFSFLRDDSDFQSVVTTYLNQPRDPEQFKEASGIIRDFDSFLEFIKIERTAFVKVGISEKSVDQMLGNIIRIRSQLDKAGLPQPEEIQQAINKLAEDTCSAKDAFKAEVEQQERYRQFSKWTLKLTGLVIVVVNGAGSSIGITAPVGIVSAIAGGVLIDLGSEL